MKSSTDLSFQLHYIQFVWKREWFDETCLLLLAFLSTARHKVVQSSKTGRECFQSSWQAPVFVSARCQSKLGWCEPKCSWRILLRHRIALQFWSQYHRGKGELCYSQERGYVSSKFWKFFKDKDQTNSQLFLNCFLTGQLHTQLVGLELVT